jgi:hypothetical protein
VLFVLFEAKKTPSVSEPYEFRVLTNGLSVATPILVQHLILILYPDKTFSLKVKNLLKVG